MFEQQVELEVFLIARLDADAILEIQAVKVRGLRGRVIRKTAQREVADILLKVPVLDRDIPPFRCRDEMHEHIVADFHKVAEPVHRLQRLLGPSDRHYRQEKNTHQCYLSQTLHGFSLRSIAAACPYCASAPCVAERAFLKAPRQWR